MKTLIIVILSICASYMLVLLTGDELGNFADGEFLFNYLGIILGFAITLYTFIVSQFEQIIQKIDDKYIDLDENQSRKARFKVVCKETKHDVLFIFIELVLVILITRDCSLNCVP